MPAARAQAIAAAQKAFFDQALASGAASAASVRAPAASPAVTGAAAATPTLHAARLSFDPAEPAPARPLRPGSLLDIKV